MGLNRLSHSICGNLFIITFGCIIVSLGVKCIAVPHGFISGGFTGFSLLTFYTTNLLTPGSWFFIINIPVFLFAWLFVGKKFFLYSIYGMLCLTLAIDLVSFEFSIQDKMLAAFTSGAIMGAGSGIIFHSLGSGGGLDIIGVILNQKFGFQIGAFFFGFNIVLFSASFFFLDNDLILYSLVLNFVASQVMDYTLTVFNQRKFALIISDKVKDIAPIINERLKKSSTFINGRGAYSGRTKRILITVVNNYQLKRLENIVFAEDPDAFMVIEKTFNVFGKGFSQYKQYS